MLYPVSEIFYSLQGEGFHTGRPAIFIRLSGCNLKCPWCDTEHFLKERMSSEEICTRIKDLLCQWACNRNLMLLHQDILFVITGGEPTLYNVINLASGIREFFPINNIALETNGRTCETFEMMLARSRQVINWITVSPKIMVEDCEKYFKNPYWRGDELKAVLEPGIDQSRLAVLPYELGERFKYYYIQPCSGDNIPAIKFVQENPIWRLSLQTQKILNIQ